MATVDNMSNPCSVHCPLCTEEMDPTDQHLKPCKCGYEICVWCWNHIIQMAEKNETEGRCPACRVPYDKDRILRITISTESLIKHDSQKKKLPKAKPKSQELPEDLQTVRVIQRNLVYVSGVPSTLADEMTLRRKEFFGQYGKIARVVVVPPTEAFLNSRVVYITFCKQEDALRCIEVVDGYILNESPLKACFGTTRYCHTWLKNRRCSKPDCLYVHDICPQEDICTKEKVASACTREVQKSSGCVSKILLPRSGIILPPPVDTCSRSKDSGGKATLQSLANEHYFNGRKHAEKGDELSSLPPTASWASPLAGTLSYASVTVPQGPSDRSHTPFSFIRKTTVAEAGTPAHFQNVNQISEEQSTGKKFTTDTHGLDRTSDTFIGKIATELEENIGLLNFRALDQEIIAIESDAYASSCDNYHTEKFQKVRATQVGTNLDRSKLELSVASANDIMSYSRLGKAKLNTPYVFCSSFNQGNQGIDCFDGVSVGSSSPSGYSVHGSSLKGVSATHAYSPYHNKLSESSNEILINSLNTINNSAVCVDNSYSLSTFNTGSSDILGCPFSYSAYPAVDLQNGACGNEDFELQSLDYRSHRSILEKNIIDRYIGDSRVNRMSDEADKFWKENDILSDFLSLDLSRVGHLIGAPLLARHFPDTRSNSQVICDYETTCNRGNSERVFASVDNSNRAIKTPCINECNASNVGNFGQLYNADKGAIYAQTCVDSALPVSHLNEHKSVSGQHNIFTTKPESRSKSHFSSCQSAYASKLTAAQLPAIPVLSRSIPPPGFRTQGSGLKSDFHGYSNASFHREINRESNYTNDCAATEFSIRGMSQSSQLVSPNCDSSSFDPAKSNNMLRNSTNLAENPVIVNESGTSFMEKNNTYWENRVVTFDVPPGSPSSESCIQETEVTKRSLSGILNSLIPGSKFGPLR